MLTRHCTVSQPRPWERAAAACNVAMSAAKEQTSRSSQQLQATPDVCTSAWDVFASTSRTFQKDLLSRCVNDVLNDVVFASGGDPPNRCDGVTNLPTTGPGTVLAAGSAAGLAMRFAQPILVAKTPMVIREVTNVAYTHAQLSRWKATCWTPSNMA